VGSVKAGVQAIIAKINEDANRDSSDKFAQTKDAIDLEIDGENALFREDMDKQREVLEKHTAHEYARRLEYQRSRLNRELLVYQHELTDEIFDMVVLKLREVANDEFSIMFQAAVKGLKGSYTLLAGELSAGKLNGRALGGAMGDNVGLDLALSSETIPGKSGFVLRDDRVEYNNLFEDLVEDMKHERAAAILKEVFGDTRDWMFS